MTIQSAKVILQYSALPRESKQELEKVLREWVSWHRALFPPAVALPATMQLFNGVLEFAPALLPEANGAVPFVDIPRPGKQQATEHPQKRRRLSHFEESGDVPRYDCTMASLDPKEAHNRVLGSIGKVSGTSSGSLSVCMQTQTRQRCWNCGSYSHTLRNCWQARDEEAILEARQALLDSSRKPILGPKRYFSEQLGEDEFPDLAPGRLSQDLREALGIAAGAPPPWLHRMQALGYPPGYRVSAQEEDVAADIIIMDGDGRSAQAAVAADDEAHEINIMDDDVATAQPAVKPPAAAEAGAELVAFPGVNAPLPEDADPLAWGWATQEVASNGQQHAMAKELPGALETEAADGWPQQQLWQQRDARAGASPGWGVHAMHAMQSPLTWAAPSPGTTPPLWPAAPAHAHTPPSLPPGPALHVAAHAQAAAPGCWPAQAPQTVQPQAGEYSVQQQGHPFQALPYPNVNQQHQPAVHQPAPAFLQAIQHQQTPPSMVHALPQQHVHFMYQAQPQHMPLPRPDMGQLWAGAIRSASVDVQPPPPPPLPPELGLGSNT